MNGWQYLVGGGSLVCFAACATITAKLAADSFDEDRYLAGLGWWLATMGLYLPLWAAGLLVVEILWPQWR